MTISWTSNSLITTIARVEIIVRNIAVIATINRGFIVYLFGWLMTRLKVYIVLIFRISRWSQFWTVEMLNFFRQNLFVFIKTTFIWRPSICVRIATKFFLKFTLNFLIVNPTDVFVFLNLSIMLALQLLWALLLLHPVKRERVIETMKCYMNLRLRNSLKTFRRATKDPFFGKFSIITILF